ncbi:MAG: four helix bundle protein [Phycisphaerales bacterium]|nr:four helix bundle protein [Phycisphaerales bacterium]
MVRSLPKDVTGQVITRQLSRCGTSIGANIEEAQGAQSRAEFARRMNIALSEARETSYWLRLMRESGIARANRLENIIQESEELISILKKTRQTKVK